MSDTRTVMRRLVFCVSLAAHGSAAWQILTLPMPAGHPQWKLEALIAIAFSAAVAVTVFGFPHIATVYTGVVLHATVMFVVGYPLGGYVGVELVLLVALLVETLLLASLVPGLLISGVETTVLLVLQRPVTAWWETTEAPGESRVVLLATVGVSTVALCFVVRYLAHRLEDTRAYANRLDEAVVKMTASNLGYQKYALQLQEQTVLEERKRITREIHDTVGYAMTNIVMLMEAATDLTQERHSRLRRLLKLTRDQAGRGLEETRRALRTLRAMELPRPDWIHAIQRLVELFRLATSIEVTVEYSNAPWKLEPARGEAIYRMIQEGMTNAFRHGKASRIDIHFWAENGTLRVRVHDNGRGASAVEDGVGLSGMRERIESVNGTLRVRTVEDGFEIAAEIPSVDRDGEH